MMEETRRVVVDYVIGATGLRVEMVVKVIEAEKKYFRLQLERALRASYSF